MDDHVFPATLANNKVIQGKLSLLSTFFCFENVNNQQKRKRKNQFLYIHSSKFPKKKFSVVIFGFLKCILFQKHDFIDR